MRQAIVLMAVAGAVAMLAGCNMENQPRTFTASLTGKAEVPPVRTQAKGQARIEINAARTQLHFKIDVVGVQDARAAYVHLALRGKSGPAVIELFAGEKPGPFTGTLAEGTITSIRFLDGLQGKSMADLIERIEDRQVYLEIRTYEHPDGELRGWFR